MNKSFNFFSSLISFKTNFSGKKKLKARKKLQLVPDLIGPLDGVQAEVQTFG